MKKIKVTHLTSAHPRYDARVFMKECSSLAKIEEYHVSLVVADGLGDEIKNGVEIFDVGKLEGRLNRIVKTTKRVFEKAKELDSDIYHIHDPELISVALRLKKRDKKVIFDIHEDVPKQIMAKPYLNGVSKRVLSFLYGLYEGIQCKKFDYIITPTPYINQRFKKLNKASVEVRNYPIIDELVNDTVWSSRKEGVCHIGSLAQTRGVLEIIQSLAFSHTRLALGGDFRPKELKNRAKALSGWKYVDYLGYLSRDEVKSVLSKTKIGLVTLHPTDSYLEAIPVKMFEYMAAGIPVIASDFPLYREMLQGCDCALFVDPLDPKGIADATMRLLKDDEMAHRMGENGKKSVLERFNWSSEEKKLYDVYKELTR